MLCCVIVAHIKKKAREQFGADLDNKAAQLCLLNWICLIFHIDPLEGQELNFPQIYSVMPTRSGSRNLAF